MRINYALSGWIANLGVDPLFSFAFFLFAPALLFLAFLIFRVCVVLEAISYSLIFLINIVFKKVFLPKVLIFVKAFLFTLPCTSSAFSQKQDIFLSKGEQIELKVLELESFSVGNKEVLKYKYLPQRGILLLKGKVSGFTDLVTWNKKKEKKVYHFYVTSKKEQLKKMKIAQILKSTQLRTQVSGELIYVEGEVKKLSSYLLLKNLEKKKFENLILNVKVELKLKNSIVAKIYTDLYQQGFEFVSCQIFGTKLNCEFKGFKTQEQTQKALEKYKNEYLVNFIDLSSLKSNMNYQLMFKIISLESDTMDIRDSGLNSIQTRLSSLLESKNILLNSHNIFLKDKNLTAKIIATPEVNTIINQKFKIQLGGEIPFKQKSDDKESVHWKFVGLQINGDLSLKGKQILLKHKSFITRSANKGITGPRGESAIYIPLDKFTKLYSLNIRQESVKEDGIPYLNKVPFLKHLFMSTSQQSSYKKIIVFAKLVEIK